MRPVTPKSGDFNGDGFVTLDEAMIVARVVTGYSPVITSEQFAAVDMDFDGVLTMTDISLIMRRTCGLQ